MTAAVARLPPFLVRDLCMTHDSDDTAPGSRLVGPGSIRRNLFPARPLRLCRTGRAGRRAAPTAVIAPAAVMRPWAAVAPTAVIAVMRHAQLHGPNWLAPFHGCGDLDPPGQPRPHEPLEGGRGLLGGGVSPAVRPHQLAGGDPAAP